MFSRQRLVKLDDLVLGEVWSTGSTPFPSEASSFLSSSYDIH